MPEIENRPLLQMIAVPVLPSISAQSAPEMLANPPSSEHFPPNPQKTGVSHRKARQKEPFGPPRMLAAPVLPSISPQWVPEMIADRDFPIISRQTLENRRSPQESSPIKPSDSQKWLAAPVLSEHFRAMSSRNAREPSSPEHFPAKLPENGRFLRRELARKGPSDSPKMRARPVLPSISAQWTPEMIADPGFPDHFPPKSAQLLA